MHRIQELFTLPLTSNVVLFALMLAIILIIPIVMRKIHLPQVIGLILCGVALGPHALNVVDNTGAIGLFSTIGLLYIMFTAGLELDINQFKINRNNSLLFGLFTYLGPLVVLFPVCYWGFDLSALQSFLVASMFGTHTLIAYPAVSRIGVSRDASVAVTVGGTILVDAGVLILLAVLLGLASGNLTFSFWANLIVSLVVFSAIMFFVIPRIAAAFFAHWHHERYLRFIFVMLMVFVSGLLAEIAGLEAIVGAFLAGLVLNRFIPHHSSLMHHIEFVGNAIFIPFFLVTVGMLVDIGVLTQGPQTLLVAGVLSAAALAGKWIAAFVAQKCFGYSVAQRRLIFGLSGARVAATLAIVLVAYRAGLIDVIFLNATIILILITCIVASLVTESAAHQLAVELDDGGTHPQVHAAEEHILVPIANPAHAHDILAFAALIKSPASPHPVTLLSVVRDATHAETNIRTFKKAAAPLVQAHPGLIQVTATIDPSLSDGILRSAQEQLANLILFGWPAAAFTDHFIAPKWHAFAHDIAICLMFLDLPQPLQQPRRLLLCTLPNAERTDSFDAILAKIAFLATQNALSIAHIGTPATSAYIRDFLTQSKQNIPFTSDDADPFAPSPLDTDWLVFVSARPKTLTHVPRCEHLPADWQKAFPKHNKILVFPADKTLAPDSEEYLV